MVQTPIHFLGVFRGAVESLGLYPAGNPTVQMHFKKFFNLIEDVTRNQPSYDLVIQDGMILVNGELQDGMFHRSPNARWVIKFFFEHFLTSISFLKGPSMDDLIGLARILNIPPAKLSNHESVPVLLREARVRTVSVNQISTLRTDQGVSNYMDQLPQQEVRSGAPKSVGNRITIPVSDASALRKTVEGHVRGGRLDRVAELLNHICRDLFSHVADDRALAVASYQIVAETLIEANQIRPLSEILKAIRKDIENLREIDLYEYHVDTLVKVMSYFLAQERPAQVVFGLDYLADLSTRGDVQRRVLARASLTDFFTEECALLLTKTIDRNAPHKRQVEGLFQHRGPDLLHAMLTVLYATRDRSLRHRFLAIMIQMGPFIYPDLVGELKACLEKGSPWYSVRNLLQVLSVKPPVALVPILHEIMKTTPHVKVEDLVLKCVYAINDKGAFKLGRRLLAQAQSTQRSKVLGFIGSGGIKAYSPILIEALESESNEEIRKALINALARLETSQGFQYLAGLMDNTSLFGGKSLSQARITVAQALLRCQSPDAKRVLLRHRNDRNKTIRELASRAATKRTTQQPNVK